jgi:hypothetical protein
LATFPSRILTLSVDEHHRVDRVQRPVLPLRHAVDDLVGDRGDGLAGHLRAVDLGQMRRHLPGGQPSRGQRDHQLVDPGQPPLALGDDLRLERAVPVAGDVDLDRPDLGQHGLGAVPVAGVPAIAPGRVVAVIAEVVGDLALERGLDQPLRQLGQQAALTGQRQPTLARSPGQAGDQLLVHRVQPASADRHTAVESVQVHSLPLGHHISHRVLPPRSELHRCFYSPSDA